MAARLLIDRVRSGRPVAHVAAEMGISRATAPQMGPPLAGKKARPGLHDRSSRPRTTPHRTPAAMEARCLAAHAYPQARPPPASARSWACPPLHGPPHPHPSRPANRLAWLDRPTGIPIRRYEHPRPGDLVHIDVKKLGRIPDGGGRRVHGRDARPGRHHRGRRLRLHPLTPSTTTPASPTARSTPMREPPPARPSSPGPPPSSPPTASPASNG